MSLIETIRGILITSHPNEYEKIKTEDNFLNRALKVAYDEEDWQLLKIALEAGADPNFLVCPDPLMFWRRHPLCYAIFRGWSIYTEELVYTFLKYGLDCNVRHEDGYLIHFALKYECSWAIRLISEFGGDLNLKNKIGNTALNEVIFDLNTNRNREFAELLLSLGADIECTYEDNCFRSPIVIATLSSNLETVEFILKHGIDVNKIRSNLQGMTLLMLAAHWGNDTVCELLLDYNADPAIKTKDGQNALWFAFEPVCFASSGFGAEEIEMNEKISAKEPEKIKCQKLLQKAMTRGVH